jgi:hypothetical protein
MGVPGPGTPRTTCAPKRPAAFALNPASSDFINPVQCAIETCTGARACTKATALATEKHFENRIPGEPVRLSDK